MLRVALALTFLWLASPPLQAQEDPSTGFMVHQLWACPSTNLPEINRLVAQTTPILDELVEEGMIRAWYDLRHGWGDEWNVGFVTVADSHEAWLDYWSEYLQRVQDQHPNFGEEFQPLCTMHKDNMYAIHDSRTDGS